MGRDAEAVSPRASELRAWWASHGDAAKQGVQALSSEGGGQSEPKSLAELQADSLSLGTDGANSKNYHTISPARITFFHEDRQPFYRACPCQVSDDRNPGKPRGCFKKVEQA